jgi:hypothetical protein
MLSFSKNSTITMTCLIMASLLFFTSPASASSANAISSESLQPQHRRRNSLRESSSRTLQDPAAEWDKNSERGGKDDLPDDFGPDDHQQQYPSSDTGSTCPSSIFHGDQCFLPEGHRESMCFVSDPGVTVYNSYNQDGKANNKCRCYTQDNPNPTWICSPLTIRTLLQGPDECGDKDDYSSGKDFGPDNQQQQYHSYSNNTGSTCPSNIIHGDQCFLPEGHRESMYFVSDNGVTVSNSYYQDGQANNKCRCFTQENPNPTWNCSPLN